MCQNAIVLYELLQRDILILTEGFGKASKKKCYLRWVLMLKENDEGRAGHCKIREFSRHA